MWSYACSVVRLFSRCGHTLVHCVVLYNTCHSHTGQLCSVNLPYKGGDKLQSLRPSKKLQMLFLHATLCRSPTNPLRRRGYMRFWISECHRNSIKVFVKELSLTFLQVTTTITVIRPRCTCSRPLSLRLPFCKQ